MISNMIRKWDYRMVATQLNQYNEVDIVLDSYVEKQNHTGNVLSIMQSVGDDGWELVSLTYPSVFKTEMIFKRLRQY